MKKIINLAGLAIVILGILSWQLFIRDQKTFMEGVYSRDYIAERHDLLRSKTIRQDTQLVNALANGILSDLTVLASVDEVIGNATSSTILCEKIKANNQREFYKDFNLDEIINLSSVKPDDESRSRMKNIIDRLRLNGSIYKNFTE